MEKCDCLLCQSTKDGRLTLQTTATHGDTDLQTVQITKITGNRDTVIAFTLKLRDMQEMMGAAITVDCEAGRLYPGEAQHL